ncbi:MAG: hypothetical protein HZC13_06615 [Nitrospirae bacterium]|nr:hypothetical protein [Nitrospirota bacterium]
MKKGMIYNIWLVGATMFALVACGTGDPGGLAGGGIGGTGISVGKITAFGSVFVNGVEFETSDATITTDGKTAIQDDLEIGMIVAVEGTFNVDGVRGTAKSIKFKDNLEGPVGSVDTGAAQTLTVLGQTVKVDSSTDIYDVSGNSSDIKGVRYTLSSIDINSGDIVEVSGFVDSTGVIHATYIKVKESSGEGEIEIKGTISNLHVNFKTFNIGALVVDYNGDVQIEVPNGLLSNDQFVEVKGTSVVDNAGVLTLTASKIEAEDEIFSIAGRTEGGKVEVEGVVTSVTNRDLEKKFEINNGQQVQITDNTKIKKNDSVGSVIDITLGARLKVEGTLDANGVLIAKEISIESEDGSGSPDDGSGESGH